MRGLQRPDCFLNPLLQDVEGKMTARHDLQEVIELLQASDNPVAQMRDWISDSGGDWCDDSHAGLFEVQYLGIAGIGVGPVAAVRAWIKNATATNQSDVAAYSLAS
jgi:hypothetical protein